MKKKLPLMCAILFCFGIFITSSSFSGYAPYYIPIFMERSELEKSISYQSSGRDLVQPGKIYYKAPYIYVNEKYKGIHVIDNSNPNQPQNIAFIIAPGCIDMAIKGDIIYIDNAVDLVAFDLNTKQVTKRITNVFPEPNAPDHHYYIDSNRPKDFIIVGWKKNPDKN